MYNLRYNQADALNMLLLMMGYATLARLVLTFSSANGNVTIFWIPAAWHWLPCWCMVKNTGLPYSWAPCVRG